MLSSLSKYRVGGRVWQRTLTLALLATLAVPCGTRGLAFELQPPSATATEFNLKLARLYATAKFISWPDESRGPAAPFVIGVIAPDPFQGGLQKLAGRKIKDRSVRTVVVRSVKDYQPCHLLFIPVEADPRVVDDILKLTVDQPVLIWRDQAEPLNSAGVACTFVREGDSLLIETDPAELKRRGLDPDARLLSLNLVRIVKPRK